MSPNRLSNKSLIHKIMKEELFVFALSALCGLSAEATINIAGVEKQVDTLECRTVGPGVQYVRMHMPEYPLDVYTMTIDLNNPYTMWMLSSEKTMPEVPRP